MTEGVSVEWEVTVYIDAELIEKLAEKLAPDLFSEDERTAHRAASPFSVTSQRDGVRQQAGEILRFLAQPEFKAAIKVLQAEKEHGSSSYSHPWGEPADD